MAEKPRTVVRKQAQPVAKIVNRKVEQYCPCKKGK